MNNNTFEDIQAWLRLTQTEGIGQETVRHLLSAFGLPKDILTLQANQLKNVVTEQIAQRLLNPSSTFLKELDDLSERTYAWSTEPEHYFITLADQNYPPALLSLPDPPPIIYVRGKISLLSSTGIAVVGSRNATAQGKSNAEKFSRALSDAGITVISGLAYGIDASAHSGALSGPGSTIAVLGTGIDRVYPAAHRSLAHEIAANGILLSEHALGSPPKAFHFPRRNRLIAGLSQGVLVVEAAAQSGSLITARLAAELGHDIFAIPGSIHSPLSKGCHFLIKQGAKLVETAQDIFDELPQNTHQGMSLKNLSSTKINDTALSASTSTSTSSVSAISFERTINPQDAEDTEALLKTMGYEPIGIEQLCMHTGYSAGDLNSRLLLLEIDGKIVRLPGGMYQQTDHSN